MRDPSYWRRFAYALLAFAAVLAIGTVVFQALLDEGWVASASGKPATVASAGCV